MSSELKPNFGDKRIPERIWRKITVSDAGCWEWNGHRIWSGYGRVRDIEGDRVAATHRLTYSALVGPIPPGLVIDHLCKVRWCCNPEHLEPVTQRENVLRGDTLPNAAMAQTHCKHGHEFNEMNSTVDRHGHRICVICRREACRQYKARRRLREGGVDNG